MESDQLMFEKEIMKLIGYSGGKDLGEVEGRERINSKYSE